MSVLLLEKAYEDNLVVVYIKPPGLATMGEGSGVNSVIKSNCLLLNPESITNAKYKKAVPVHRLDKCTGGLLLCSKNVETEISLKEAFRERHVSKRYIALVAGKFDSDSGVINSPISEKEAITSYKVVKCTRSHAYQWISTVHLWPHTGRKHQLRRHMRECGHPIIGDVRHWDNIFTPIHHMRYIPDHLHDLCLWAVEIQYPIIAHSCLTSSPSLETSDTNNRSTAQCIKPNDDVSKDMSLVSKSIKTVQINEPLCYEELRSIEENVWNMLQNDVRY